MRHLYSTLTRTAMERHVLSAKVFRNSYGEYVARMYINGRLYEPADCFETDLQSACDTAHAMVTGGTL